MNVRPAAVAGLFYPDEPGELARLVGKLLAGHKADKNPPKALIVPHAGYIYSGPTAAMGFAQLSRAKPRRIVLFGPAHRVPFRGLALPESDHFSTPLGLVPLDEAAMETALAHPAVLRMDIAHTLEHSLEVQLPFLQHVLDSGFRLVPLVVGDASAEDVAEVMQMLWGGEETLILVSSDLSHYLPYEQARRIDRETIRKILKLAGPIRHDEACGATGINGLLLAAGASALRPRLIDYRNSGDTAGDRSQVVGYASIAFDEAGP